MLELRRRTLAVAQGAAGLPVLIPHADRSTSMNPTRRRLFAGLAALAVAPLLAACGDDGTSEATDGPASGSVPARSRPSR